ncbi:MAG: 50S ribosomal protein L25 [Bdellovibrionaceae bacterium]|nr:50S ribosomal protein L25 [Pseudobdellovibrionaceae bacterium]MDW8190748.1 50S ribosomal protein L25 [Pseudobdellovibrionaceae bacterium]
MATQRVQLNVEVRQTGKHWARVVRKQRKVPAVIYGAVKENLFVSIDENAVLKYRSKAYENALFNIQVNGQEVVALIKSIQKHPVTHRPEHVDLMAIDLNKPIRLAIELKFEGKPVGLAEGGLLTIVNRSVEIECLPTQIPDAITVDVSSLGVGDSLHVADIKLPDHVKLISPADMTLAVVNVQEEEAAATATTEAAGTGATPGASSGAGASAASAASNKEVTAKDAAKDVAKDKDKDAKKK